MYEAHCDISIHYAVCNDQSNWHIFTSGTHRFFIGGHSKSFLLTNFYVLCIYLFILSWQEIRIHAFPQEGLLTNEDPRASDAHSSCTDSWSFSASGTHLPRLVGPASCAGPASHDSKAILSALGRELRTYRPRAASVASSQWAVLWLAPEPATVASAVTSQPETLVPARQRLESVAQETHRSRQLVQDGGGDILEVSAAKPFRPGAGAESELMQVLNQPCGGSFET